MSNTNMNHYPASTWPIARRILQHIHEKSLMPENRVFYEEDIDHIARDMRVSVEAVENDYERLLEGNYVTGFEVRALGSRVTRLQNCRLTEAGAEKLGIWPSQNALNHETLIAALMATQMAAQGEEEKSRIAGLIENIRDFSTETVAKIIFEVVSRSIL